MLLTWFLLPVDAEFLKLKTTVLRAFEYHSVVLRVLIHIFIKGLHFIFIGNKDLNLKNVNSRELRASILHTGCDCEKWNGLQDQCPRRGCQGSPECLTNRPTCGPSQFSNWKHLEKKNQRRSNR